MWQPACLTDRLLALVRSPRALAGIAMGGAAGLAAALVLFDGVVDSWPVFLFKLLPFLLLGAGAFPLLAGAWIPKRLARYSPGARGAIALTALFFALLALLAGPVAPPASPSAGTVRFEITASGRRNPMARGAEVWVLGMRNGGAPIPPEELATRGPWERRGSIYLLSPRGEGEERAVLTWEGRARGEISLTFRKHPWSGIVEIDWGAGHREIDLFFPERIEDSITFFPGGELFSTLRTLSVAGTLVLLWVVIWSGMALLLGTGSVASGPAGEGEGVKVFRRPLLFYLLPLLAGWSLYFLAFHPAMMSPDSIDQWGQATRARFEQWHPVFYPLVEWLLLSLWTSPAVMSLFQVALFGLVVALGVDYLAQLRLPRLFRGLLCAVYALFPVYGAFLVTLWKDVPYGIVQAGLVLVLARIVLSRGAWLGRWGNTVLLVLLCTVAILLRYNGILPVGLLFVGLFLFYRSRWRRVLAAALLTAGLLFTVMGPFYGALGVTGGYPLVSFLTSHQVSAVVHAGGEIAPEDRAFLDRLVPLYHWRDAYDPYSSDRLLFGREHPYDFALAEKEKGRMLRVWVRVAAANLPVVITHQLKVSSVTWRVQEPPDGYTYCIPFTIVPNPYGLVGKPLLPGLRKCLQEFLRTATGSQWNWLLFRPALYLYLVLFLGLVASFKNRDGRLLLVALPVFADWSCYLGAVFAQDVRYFSSLFFTWPFLAAFYLLCTLRAAPLP